MYPKNTDETLVTDLCNICIQPLQHMQHPDLFLHICMKHLQHTCEISETLILFQHAFFTILLPHDTKQSREQPVLASRWLRMVARPAVPAPGLGPTNDDNSPDHLATSEAGTYTIVAGLAWPASGTSELPDPDSGEKARRLDGGGCSGRMLWCWRVALWSAEWEGGRRGGDEAQIYFLEGAQTEARYGSERGSEHESCVRPSGCPHQSITISFNINTLHAFRTS